MAPPKQPAAPLTAAHLGGRYWQDLDRSRPAVLDGDPVRVAEIPGFAGETVTMTAPSDFARPTLRGGLLHFDGVDDCLIPAPPG